MVEKLCITCGSKSGCENCDKSKSSWKAHPAYEMGKVEGRRAGIEEAAKVLESKLDAPGVSLQTRLTPWVDQVDCIRSCIAKIRALLEAK